MKKIKHLCMCLIVFFSVNLSAQINSISQLSNDPKFHKTINDLWHDTKHRLEYNMDNCGSNSYNLYNAQIAFEPLLRYSFKNKKYDLTDELLALFQLSIDKMVSTDKYQFYGYKDYNTTHHTTQKLDTIYAMWPDGGDASNPGIEDVLSSGQFLAMISYARFEIAKINPVNRTPEMKKFDNVFWPILFSHYTRWVIGTTINDDKELKGLFQRKGWGCQFDGEYVPTLLTHKEVIDKLTENEFGDGSISYCNAALDTDLWIISGVSNYFAALIKNWHWRNYPSSSSNNFADNNDKNGILYDYLKSAINLLEYKTTFTRATDFSGQPKVGAIFGKNDFDDLINNAYSGYTNSTIYPNANNTSYINGTGWDISHGRRFVSVFSNLHEANKTLQLSFPSATHMTQFTNQFIYKVFNKDFSYPSFSNYFSGQNGWYKVRLNKGSGHGPSDLSISVLQGMYGEYLPHNKDVDAVMTSLYNLIHFPNSSQRNFVIKTYEENLWQNFSRNDNLEFVFPLPNNTSEITIRTKLELLAFYSSICNPNTVNTKRSTTNTAINHSNKLKIFPNPSVNTVTVLGKELENIKIFDFNGKDLTNKIEILKKKTNEVELNVTHLKTGVYILKSENFTEILRKK